jgi:hypothetical protein
MALLSTANTKTMKGEKYGYKTYILHLAPSLISGFQTCPKASAGCAAACLNKAGMGAFSNVQQARINRTKMFFEDRFNFMLQLVKEIKSAKKKADKEGLKLLVRLNGTSDINFIKIRVGDYRNLFEMFPDVQFYDYTKLIVNSETIPSNYHLTFSKSESNDRDVSAAIRNGLNVAVVFDKLPKTYLGRPVVSGDESDIRINDPKNVIVGLLAKGPAKRDQSGFVVRTV